MTFPGDHARTSAERERVDGVRARGAEQAIALLLSVDPDGLSDESKIVYANALATASLAANMNIVVPDVHALAATAGAVKSQAAHLKTISETVEQLASPLKSQAEHLRAISGTAGQTLKAQTTYLKTIAGTAEDLAALPKDLVLRLDRLGGSLQTLIKLAEKLGAAAEKRSRRS